MANARRNSGPVVVGGEPRIDFLPPETKKRKQNRRQRRSLVALVILVALVCGLGFTSSTALAASSQAALRAEQAKTQELLNEQQEYAEARTAADGVATAKNARIAATANEVMWTAYFYKVLAQLPAGSIVTGLVFDAPSAIEIVPEQAILLRNPRIATMGMTVEVLDLATADLVMKNLQKIPGYADATMDLLDWDDALLVYKMEITVNISADALERRFFTPAPETDAETDTETDEDAAPEVEPSASPSPSSSPAAGDGATNSEDSE